MTLLIIILTVLTSFLAFNNNELFSKLMFNPYQVHHRKEFYRLLTHGFIHADWMHLIVNMFVLYSFGSVVEQYLQHYEDIGYLHFASAWYVFMYLVAIIISSLTTLRKHKNNVYYNAVGASGAVSAVLFCSIFFAPLNGIGFMFLPSNVSIPGIIFGPLYLLYCHYMSKRNADNINHDAHFIGAIFGFLFPMMIKFELLKDFIDRLFHF